MQFDAIVRRLEGFSTVLPAAVTGLSPEEARWKPEHPSYSGGAWSILEIINHLADEEVEDFRARLQAVLRDPAESWSPIDPEGVAVSRGYNQQDLDESVARFVAERGRSIAWLRSLHEPDWCATYQHKLGPIRAGDLLASWCAHDALHLRQIAKRLHQLAQRDSDPFSCEYAGPWGA